MQQINVNVVDVKKFIDDKIEEFKLSIDEFISKNVYTVPVKEESKQIDKRVFALTEISQWSVDNKLDNLSVADVVELIDRLSLNIEELKREK